MLCNTAMCDAEMRNCS